MGPGMMGSGWGRGYGLGPGWGDRQGYGLREECQRYIDDSAGIRKDRNKQRIEQ
jgi:hypothetical protein